MKNSSYKIYCLSKRIKFVFNNEDDNFGLVDRLLEPVPKTMFDKANKFTKEQCYRIFNEIENSYYTFDDVTNFLIYRSIWDKAVRLAEVTSDAIEYFKKKFTPEQLAKDREVMTEINKEMKFPKARDFFKIRVNGESVVYGLCMKEIVSAYFFAYYGNSFLFGFFENPKLKPRNHGYKKFYETVKILKERMNLNSHQPKKQNNQ